MSTTSLDIAAIQQRHRERNVALIDAADAAMFTTVNHSEIAAVVDAALSKLAELWRIEADDIERANKRGAKGAAETCRRSAAMVAGVAVSIRTQALADSLVSGPHGEVKPLAAEEIFGETSWPFPPTEPAVGASTADHADALRPDPAPATVTEDLSMPEPVGVPPLAQRPEAIAVPDADPFADPVGPGNRGAHAGPRLTFGDLLAPPRDPSPDHRSHSQLETFSDCGMKYRLQRREGVPQTPGWSLVGGNALHAAVEHLERMLIEGNAAWPPPILGALSTSDVERMWTEALTAEISATVSKSPSVPMPEWHAAKGGKEGYTWWIVEGQAMLQRYVDQRSAWGERWSIVRSPSGTPLVEYPFDINVEGISFQGVIDQVWYSREDHGVILVRDLKSGASKPVDTFQLGEYAHALARSAPPTLARVVRGAYWMARTGEHVGEVDDLFTRHPWDELNYRVHAMDAMDRAGMHLPRTSSYCVSCSVRSACPAAPGARGAA